MHKPTGRYIQIIPLLPPPSYLPHPQALSQLMYMLMLHTIEDEVLVGGKRLGRKCCPGPGCRLTLRGQSLRLG